MKLKDLQDYQRDAYMTILTESLKIKAAEDALYAQQFYKMLLIANGSGIVLVATFVNSLIKHSSAPNHAADPLMYFFIGMISASLIYFVIMGVANQAVKKSGQQYLDIIANKFDVEKIQGWGLSKRGIKIVWSLLIISIMSFFVGVYKSLGLIEASLQTA